MLFQDAIRLLKDNRNYKVKEKRKKEPDQSIPNMHLLWLEYGGVMINMHISDCKNEPY